MKQLFIFIQKEFYHVFRDKRTLLVLFGLPVIQILLFGFALTSEVKNLHIAILDQAKDINSQQLTAKIRASAYFIMEEPPASYEGIEQAFREGTINCALVFPPDFGEELNGEGNSSVLVIADGSDPNTARILENYLAAIAVEYAGQLSPFLNNGYRIIPEMRMLYNEEGNGSLNFIPGVVALILMLVCTALTSVSIVREKESGTMEVLLVSPFRPVWVLIAKTIPYLVLSLLNFILILALSVYVLDVTIRGSLILLFLESMLFIIACLSLGLLVSNVTHSQQAALLISMMAMMIPTLVFTGFMFPLENMPRVFQIIANLLPSRWYYLIMKAVMLKGLGFTYVWKETLILIGMTAILLTVALKNFKTRLE